MKDFLYKAADTNYSIAFMASVLVFVLLMAPAILLLKLVGRLCGRTKEEVKDDLRRHIRVQDDEIKLCATT